MIKVPGVNYVLSFQTRGANTAIKDIHFLACSICVITTKSTKYIASLYLLSHHNVLEIQLFSDQEMEGLLFYQHSRCIRNLASERVAAPLN